MGRYFTIQSVIERVKSAKGSVKQAFWRKTILLVCVVALGIDPLYLFVPVIDSPNFCFTFDKGLAAGVSGLRTFIDVFYVFHIIFNFTIARFSERTFKGESVTHSKLKRDKTHLFYSFNDILSVLPVPQVIVLTFMNRSDSLVSRAILKWIILTQYIRRILRIYPLYKEVTRESGTVAKTKWVGAAFNLFLYMLHSHVFGAFWYISSVEKRNKCWRLKCADISGCNLTQQYCERGGLNNGRYLNTTCPLIDPDQITNSTVFNFGMYIDAMKSGIVEVKPRDFPRKFFYCFWWGLRNISALGQNLKTSNSVGDIGFALVICVSGLLLLAILIGNIEKYMQSTTIRLDKMEEKKRDTEKWMWNVNLPEHLKERVKSHENEKWNYTSGIEEQAILYGFPEDLRHDIQRYLKRTPSSSSGVPVERRKGNNEEGGRNEIEDATRHDVVHVDKLEDGVPRRGKDGVTRQS